MTITVAVEDLWLVLLAAQVNRHSADPSRAERILRACHAIADQVPIPQ